MILYHFTTVNHLKNIQKKGLALGIIPVSLDPNGGNHFRFLPHWQWLTQSPDWEQDWDHPIHGTAKLPFRRTEIRITVEIPSLYAFKCIRWDAWVSRMKPASSEFFIRFPSSRFWYVYHGTIPPSWFIAVEQNPNRPTSDHHDSLLEN